MTMTTADPATALLHELQGIIDLINMRAAPGSESRLERLDALHRRLESAAASSASNVETVESELLLLVVADEDVKNASLIWHCAFEVDACCKSIRYFEETAAKRGLTKEEQEEQTELVAELPHAYKRFQALLGEFLQRGDLEWLMGSITLGDLTIARPAEI
jgi:hypothetical protein